MRVTLLFHLIAIGACARHETPPPAPVVEESALMRFLKRPFGLGLSYGDPKDQDLRTRKPYSGRNDPLYLQTLNRSRAREGTLPKEDSAFVKFLKHPFGLGHKDPVEKHIVDPYKKHIKAPVDKHIKEPIKKEIRKLERDDPLNRSRSLKHPFRSGYNDPVKEHISDPARKNVVDPVRKNVVDPVKRGIETAEHDIMREFEKDDPYMYGNAAQRRTVARESPLVRFFKHPFGLGRKDPVQKYITEPVKEYIADPVKENIVEPVQEHVVDPAKETLRKLEHEDPLNVKPLKRKVTRKLTNEGWARGRNPEEDERFLEIEETLMGTE